MRNSEPTPEEQIVREYLERALDGSTPPTVGLKMMRRFSNDVPELFRDAAFSMIEEGNDSHAQRYMAILLLKEPSMLMYLSNPRRFDKPRAVSLFRYLMTIDKLLDIRLARCLPNRNGTSEVNMSFESSERALDILDEISAGRRIVPILGHLMDHVDARIASKAALVLGKRVQGVNWAKRLLEPGQNDRLRANAIESIWGVDDAHARDLLWSHTQDPNNRVAGNAIFGLHILGDEKVNSVVKAMAVNGLPEFRWTAAWTMSKIADAEFVPTLRAMMKDDIPGVRRAALKALVSIHTDELRQDEMDEKTEPGDLEDVPQDQVDLLEQGPGSKPAPDIKLDGRSFSFRNGK